MLITNFASGELSKTLFGRTDLPQFYCGASKLQNFDVLPTGGLRRRSGMEHLKTLDKEGRLIPFIVRRDLHFLLLLTPGEITVYRLVNGEIAVHPDGTPDVDVYTSESLPGIYESPEHIRDVQYAQNFDTMILCHEDYAPLQVLLTDGGRLGISTFSININVERIAVQSRVNILTEYFETDIHYRENGWLTGAGNFPRSAAFFNGRVVFAGTRNDPQRVFFSKVEDIHDFSTYKKNISEIPEYVTISGRVKIGSDQIELVDPGEIGKFTRQLSEYYVQSPYFSEGTMLAGLTGRYLRTVRNTKELTLSQQEIDVFLDWKQDIEATEWSASSIIRNYFSRGGFSDLMQFCNGKFRYLSFDISQDNVSTPGPVYEFELENIQELLTDRQKLYDFVYELIKILPNRILSGSLFIDTKIFGEFIDAFWEHIRDGRMHYPLVVQGVSLDLYGTPEQIYQQILGRFTQLDDVEASSFIALYFVDPEITRLPTPDCGFTFEVASDANDAIRWLTVNKGLIIGTEMGEFIVPPDVHATNVHAIPNSRYGSDTIQGTAIGDATVFFESGKKSLIEYYIPRDDSHFRKNNMAMLNPEILSESPAREFDFMTSPYTKLLITREDGQLVTLLYERSTGTFAWSRITTGEVSWDAMTAQEIQAEYEKWLKEDPAYRKRGEHNEFLPQKNIVQEARGKVLSVAVLPGHDGNDDIYLIVRRIVRKNIREPEQGEERYFLERLRESGARAERAVYLDGWREWKWETEAEKEALLALYGGEAVVYDENATDTFQVAPEPEVWNKYQHQKQDNDYRVIYTDCFGKTRTQNGEVPRSLPPSSDDEHRRYIGYLYTSAMRTMPLLDNKKMNDSKFTKMYVRYFDSYMPDASPLSDVRSGESGSSSGPFSGVIARTFSEGPRVDPQYETNHNRPTRYCILSMNAE
jgi:hypothetical protein